jgi:hypothetical protein
MNRPGDYDGEMRTRHTLDDATVEALLAGRTVPADLQPLAVAVAALRDAVARPVPPRADLAAQMAAGVFSGAAEDASAVDAAWGRGAPGRGLWAPARQGRVGSGRVGSGRVRRREAGAGRWAGLGRPAKAGLAALTAAVGFIAGGVAGVLPSAAQEGFESIVEAVTPYEFPERIGNAPGSVPDGGGGGEPGGSGHPGGEPVPGGPGTGTGPGRPTPAADPDGGDFGEQVSGDAKNGGADGGTVSEDAQDGGADGGAVSEEARQRGNQGRSAGRPSEPPRKGGAEPGPSDLPRSGGGSAPGLPRPGGGPHRRPPGRGGPHAGRTDPPRGRDPRDAACHQSPSRLAEPPHSEPRRSARP